MRARITALFLSVCVLLASMVIGVAPAAAESAASGFYEPLPFTAAYGTTDGAVLSELTAMDEAATTAIAKGTPDGITTDSATGIPCQVFTVDVSSCPKDEIVLSLRASTIENERLALKVLNPSTNAWDTIATAMTSTDGIGGKVNLATYAKDGKIQAMATPDYVANGSNRILWSTDQQHYTKFEDLNDTYYAIHEYMVEEYQAGRASYVINTGDIVDDMPKLSGAKFQWTVADKAFDILDDANVPYGIVTGNHDVGDYPANNYSYYLQYFAEERYAGKPWFGGTADDNKCHYDLVTVGNVDLLVLYIGYGQGEFQAVLEWANEVIAKYPHRNVILCTHQFLKPTTGEHAGRADTMYEKIVLPNENVVMVLSGHYDGAAYRTMNEDGRIIQEVVADYQFVQKEDDSYYEDAKDPKHKIGGTEHCNGEGYMREVLIEGNTVKMYAFSPVTGGETPFGLRDNLALEVPFAPAERRITTSLFAAGYEASSGMQIDCNTAEDGTATYVVAAADGSDYTATLNADKTDLQTLIETASTLRKKDFTKNSFAPFNAALKTAKTAVKGDDDQAIRDAFVALTNAMGALAEKVDTMDPEKLTVVADIDLDLSNWKNGDGTKSLFTDNSFLAVEQLEDGGFTAQKSARSPNSWPAIVYTEPITFTPEDGKVYLYLDLEATSTWSFYPTVIQDGTQYMDRWNYIIEGSYNKTSDAGSGVYKGVFDVTDALIAMGVDVYEEMTMTISINMVPGPVTIHDLDILTGEYPDSFFAEYWVWFAVGGGVVIIAGLVLFAILYQPKKKEDTADDPQNDQNNDNNTEE